ncbi:hypothetical protein HBB16_01470 [Pseudonocardia sp. MCCB 268]|nr:hypothetical protein [Pseudonocardia cytotoxica]
MDSALNADIVVAGRSAFFEVPAVRLGLPHRSRSPAGTPGCRGPLLPTQPSPVNGSMPESPDVDFSRASSTTAAAIAASGIAARLQDIALHAPAASASADFDAGRVDPAVWHERRQLSSTGTRCRARAKERTPGRFICPVGTDLGTREITTTRSRRDPLPS